MSLEHSPARIGHNSGGEHDRPGFDYWHSLIDESGAADFLDVSKRLMQAMRQIGNGPQYIRLSARCIRYRRIDLHAWSEDRLRSSTSDPGPQPAAT